MFSHWLTKNWYYHRSLKTFYRRFVEPEMRVLQIDCRNGYLLDAVKAGYGVGVDEHEPYIKEARDTYRQYHFFVGSIFEYKSDEKFDYIILSSVMMEVYDIQDLFDNLRRFCHPSTRILVDSYSAFWEPILWLTQKLGLRRPTEFKHWVSQDDIVNLFYLSDFEVVVKGRFMLFPIFIPLVSLVINRVLAHIPGVNRLCLNQYVIVRLWPEPEDSDRYSVSVIIPCKNERGTIKNAVLRTPQMGKSTELIFVEGGSTDGTFEEIQKVIKEFPDKDIKCYKQEGENKIGAVHTGFDHASGDVLMILDGDLTVSPEELPKFLEALAERKGELINGSRLVYGMEPGAMRFIALIANWIFSTMVSFVLRQNVKDTLCGTKALFKKDYKRIQHIATIFGRADPFGDFELLFGASKLNLVIRDLPVHYKSRKYGKSQISHVLGGFMLAYMVLHGFWHLRSH